MLLPGKPDRGSQFLQYFQVFIQTSLGYTYFPCKFRRRTRAFGANKLIELEEKVKVLLHNSKFNYYIRSINRKIFLFKIRSIKITADRLQPHTKWRKY